MPTAIKKKQTGQGTVRSLRREVSRLRSRVEELEDLRDLNAAIVRNGKKAGIPWAKAEASLTLD